MRDRGRACLLWLIGCLCVIGAAHADVRQARGAIFDRHTANLLATVQSAGTDLPLSLATGRDVYLFITAGGAYTDVRVLALPSVPPVRVAQALASAVAGTPLANRPVTWSADDYSAAALQAGHGRLLSRQSANVVPVGALVAGLRRAGFVPHTLLRVPIYATAPGLPPPCRPPLHYAWYDDAQASHFGLVSVRAALTPADVALALFFLFFVGTVGVVGLTVAMRVARDERLPLDVRRRRYKAWALYPVYAAIAVHAPVMIFYLRTTHPLAVADLWLGNPSTSVMVPLIVLGPMAMAFLLPHALRVEKKLLGAAPGATITPIPMSPEEASVHARMSKWKSLPHIFCLLVFCGGLFLLPRSSPFYPMLHPLLIVVPALGSAITSLIFRKPLAAFTTTTHDDDLTWRARQFGMQMGVRPENVKVEDSSRAAHYATIVTERNKDILVSRKLLEVMSREETDFLLAHQVALQRVKGRLTPTTVLTILPMLSTFAILVWMRIGHATLAFFNWMPYVLPLMIVPILIPLFFKRQFASATARRAVEADKMALAVTGNVAAAQSALTKLAQQSLTPQGQTLPLGTFLPELAERLKALGAEPQSVLPGTSRT